jgi:hypothetical protein
LKQQGFYHQIVIANGDDAFVYDDVISEYQRSISVAKFNKNKPEFEKNVNLVKKYLEKIPEQIIYDPLGFKEAIAQGKLRSTAWAPDFNVDTILDFNAITKYDQAFRGKQFFLPGKYEGPVFAK